MNSPFYSSGAIQNALMQEANQPPQDSPFASYLKGQAMGAAMKSLTNAAQPAADFGPAAGTNAPEPKSGGSSY
jgi:hypothetical protein